MIGGVLVGGAIALVEPAIDTVAYCVHERGRNYLGKAQRGSPRRLAWQL